ncbi:MAG: hypothetical protein ACOC3S_03595 [Bacteroidota bacterium]
MLPGLTISPFGPNDRVGIVEREWRADPWRCDDPGVALTPGYMPRLYRVRQQYDSRLAQ